MRYCDHCRQPLPCACFMARAQEEELRLAARRFTDDGASITVNGAGHALNPSHSRTLCGSHAVKPMNRDCRGKHQRKNTPITSPSEQA